MQRLREWLEKPNRSVHMSRLPNGHYAVSVSGGDCRTPASGFAASLDEAISDAFLERDDLDGLRAAD